MFASRRFRRKFVALSLTAALGVVAAAVFAATPPESEAAFVAENQSAMDKMMAAMAVKPLGDADADFAAMMIPHHQGAIEMAEAELRHGHNEQLRRIAQEIIVDQQQEIAAMRLALGEPPPSIAAPDQRAPAATSAALPFKICKGSPQ